MAAYVSEVMMTLIVDHWILQSRSMLEELPNRHVRDGIAIKTEFGRLRYGEGFRKRSTNITPVKVSSLGIGVLRGFTTKKSNQRLSSVTLKSLHKP